MGRLSEAELRDRLSVYFVADPEQTTRDILTIVDEALAGGAGVVQLRAKRMGGREMLELALAMGERCRRAGRLFIVNDRVDVAMASDADGVHVGMHDLPLEATRRLVGPDKIIGFSPLTLDDVRTARPEGADYVGLGPVYGTASKADAQPPLGLADLAEQVTAAGLPAVGIGGIDAENAEAVIRAGADGVAVISAIQQAADPQLATRALAQAVARAKSES